MGLKGFKSVSLISHSLSLDCNTCKPTYSLYKKQWKLMMVWQWRSIVGSHKLHS